MIKTRGKNRKSNKKANLNLEQDNKPSKLIGMAAELAGEPNVLAEELAESTGEKLKAKLATRPSQEKKKQRPAKSMADLESILQKD